MKQDGSHRYDDIIGLSHHQSAIRPHMPLTNRAAQFSPFAALTGYEAVRAETARLTGHRIELGEDAKAAIAQSALEIHSRTSYNGDQDTKTGRSANP